ncbi:hypothetical protein [Nocardia rhamnosiphila]|uniref:Uncharacterized protein n=1 Tax=Nocardia rhamnosiphila TaxID=426716 RepID=A0ABV2WR82_9NOCA
MTESSPVHSGCAALFGYSYALDTVCLPAQDQVVLLTSVAVA